MTTEELQLLGAGSPPRVPLRSRGPRLAVTQMAPVELTCKLWSWDPVGSPGTAPRGCPVEAENISTWGASEADCEIATKVAGSASSEFANRGRCPCGRGLGLAQATLAMEMAITSAKRVRVISTGNGKSDKDQGSSDKPLARRSRNRCEPPERRAWLQDHFEVDWLNAALVIEPWSAALQSRELVWGCSPS